MERKVFAEIKFKKRLDEISNTFSVLNCINKFEFYPCEVLKCLYQYPLKIVIPSSACDSLCQWLYTLTFGGGLVEGDNVSISLEIDANCCILITTLSYPKVFCCVKGIESQQNWTVNVESGSLLCVLPDPLVCYKQASYIQTQTYYLQMDSNLVLLDWFTSGRYERQEQWLFSKLKSIVSVFVNKNLSFREAQNLQHTPLVNIKKSMKSYNLMGICIIIGPCLDSLVDIILQDIGRCKKYGEKIDKRTLFAGSPLYLNETSKRCGCIVRFATESVSEGTKKIEEMLYPLYSIIGENPFTYK